VIEVRAGLLRADLSTLIDVDHAVADGENLIGLLRVLIPVPSEAGGPALEILAVEKLRPAFAIVVGVCGGGKGHCEGHGDRRKKAVSFGAHGM